MIRKKATIKITIVIAICVCIISWVWNQQYKEYNRLNEDIQSTYMIISLYYDDIERMGSDYEGHAEIFNGKVLQHFGMSSKDILARYNFEYEPSSYLFSLGAYGQVSYNADDSKGMQIFIELVSYIDSQMEALSNVSERRSGLFIPIFDNFKIRDEILRTYSNIFYKLVDSLHSF